MALAARISARALGSSKVLGSGGVPGGATIFQLPQAVGARAPSPAPVLGGAASTVTATTVGASADPVALSLSGPGQVNAGILSEAEMQAEQEMKARQERIRVFQEQKRLAEVSEEMMTVYITKLARLVLSSCLHIQTGASRCCKLNCSSSSFSITGTSKEDVVI